MSVARARLVAAGALCVVVFAAFLIPVSVAAFGRDGTLSEDTQAFRARRAAERLGAPPADLVLAVTDAGRPADSAARSAQAVSAALAREPGVRAVWSGATGAEPWLRSRDGGSVLVLARLDGSKREQEKTADRLVERARAVVPDRTVQASGPAWTLERVDRRIEHDLLRAELMAAPIVLVVLLMTYGSLASALMPVMVAGVAVGCTIPVLGGMARLVHVSSFAVNAALAVGFGLAVDYTLFLLARYREELAGGHPRAEALTTAVRTSGRSVAFSAAAVTVCLSAVTLIPVPLVRALALAGVTVTVLSAAAALLLTPACVVLLGPLCERGDPFRRWRRIKLGQGSPFWRRTAQVVTRRWAVAGGAAVVLLAMMAWPFAHAQLGIMDYRVMPASSEVASVGERVRAEFPGAPEQVVTVVVPAPAPSLQLFKYRRALAGITGVTDVRVLAGSRKTGTVFGAATTVRAGSSEAATLVKEARALPSPGPVLVGGRAAEVVDTLAAVKRALPRAVALLGVGLALLLALFTRSLVTPLKALVVAVVSLGASLGAVVAVFQEGTARSLLGGFTVTGALDISLLLFTLTIALSLSVDYEVFLLGRIREEYQRCADNRAAVVEGIARTGRLMTSAALAVAVSTAAMITSSVSVIKMTGAGVALAVLVDAVLVRGALVPAVMAALGPANWWLPAIGRRRLRLPVPKRAV